LEYYELVVFRDKQGLRFSEGEDARKNKMNGVGALY